MALEGAEKYMAAVDALFEIHEAQNGRLKGKRKVFVATDDPAVVDEVR